MLARWKKANTKIARPTPNAAPRAMPNTNHATTSSSLTEPWRYGE